MFTAQAGGASTWMQAAVTRPDFEHPRVTGASATIPTGGTHATVAATYVQVLGYLASHKAWEHFETVLVRGIMVSEAEDQDL